MNKKDKDLFLIISGILVFVALCFFSKAIFNSPQPSPSQEMQIKVFINQNDSIISNLQKDVEHLTFLMENMQADTVVLEIRKHEK